MADPHLRLLESGMRLYERAVMVPGAIDADELSEWAGDLASESPPRDVVRTMRRIMRKAEKMASFWLAELAHSDEWGELRRSQLEDWVARVDEASGIPAWRELLDVAEAGLRAGSTGVEEHIAWLFPQVNHAEWPGREAVD